jgi:hypothetical protein
MTKPQRGPPILYATALRLLLPAAKANRAKIPSSRRKKVILMFKTWMDFAFDAARLAQETQEVMALRMMKLAAGGSASRAEAERMVTEKSAAAAEAFGTLAFGGSMQKVVRRYRTHVRANKRRLTRN